MLGFESREIGYLIRLKSLVGLRYFLAHVLMTHEIGKGLVLILVLKILYNFHVAEDIGFGNFTYGCTLCKSHMLEKVIILFMLMQVVRLTTVPPS